MTFDVFSNQRRATRLLLLAIIVLTLPCYCVGLALLGIAPSSAPKSTKVPTNVTLGGMTSTPFFTPTYTPFGLTATPTQGGAPLLPTPGQLYLPTATPFYLPPTATLTLTLAPAPTLTQAPTLTLAPTLTPSLTLVPTNPPTNPPPPTAIPTETPTEVPPPTAVPTEVPTEVPPPTAVPTETPTTAPVSTEPPIPTPTQEGPLDDTQNTGFLPVEDLSPWI
jgi:hypothetical protein